jgi:ketosteroid isomerase-like protein
MVTLTTESLNIFFYGSFMDLELLRTLGVVPKTFGKAELKNWSIAFSSMATLVQSEGDSVYGTIAELSRDEVRMLYTRDDLKHYSPVDIAVATERNKHVPAQCYISKPGAGQKPSVDYLRRVIQAAESLGFPPAYLAKLRRIPTTQTGNSDREAQEEILEVEREFGEAMIKNDADAIGLFLSEDWIIIDPDGGIIDKPRFLAVIQSGALKHEAMDSEDIRVRTYANAATVTAVTSTKSKYLGKEFKTRERATDVFVKMNGRWQCVLTHLTTVTKKT